jgi:hypothetical protein
MVSGWTRTVDTDEQAAMAITLSHRRTTRRTMRAR